MNQPPPPAAAPPRTEPGPSATKSVFSLYDCVGSALLVHRGGAIIYANPAFQRLTGHTPDELAERSYDAIFHPDDQETVRQDAELRLQGNSIPPARQYRVVAKDGEIRQVEIKSTLVRIGGCPTLIGSFFDLTDGLRADGRQLAMQHLLAQIIDHNPVPTFVIDGEHRVTHWNKACAAITGVPAAEMIGSQRQWAAFYASERPVMADLIVSGALEGNFETHYRGKFHRSELIDGAFEAEDFFPHFGEQGCWLYFTAAPLRDLDGQLVGAIETLQNVSARHQAEDELRRYQAHLEQQVEQRTGELASANKQLIQSEKLASIGQLAAGVAHEINNPIGYVHSNISSLESYIGDLFTMLDGYETATASLADPQVKQGLEQQRRQLDIDFLKEDIPQLMGESKEGITRVKKIVQDLKDFSHVDTNPEWQWANLHRGIDSTLNIVSNEIKYKADVVKAYGDLPEVECLPTQLNQVFMNLLVNAAHAMGDTRGTITIRSGTGDNETVWLEFADNGSGIPKDIQQKIFDPFFTTKPIGKGTGLGLSLSYGIISNHNGSIDLDSEPGRGTTFRITLPIRHTETAEAALEKASQ